MRLIPPSPNVWTHAPYVYLTNDQNSKTYNLYVMAAIWEGQKLALPDISHFDFGNALGTQLLYKIEGTKQSNEIHFVGYHEVLDVSSFPYGNIFNENEETFSLVIGIELDDDSIEDEISLLYKDRDTWEDITYIEINQDKKFVANAPYAHLVRYYPDIQVDNSFYWPYVNMITNGFDLLPHNNPTNTSEISKHKVALKENRNTGIKYWHDSLKVNIHSYQDDEDCPAGYFEISMNLDNNNLLPGITNKGDKKVKVRNKTANGVPLDNPCP